MKLHDRLELLIDGMPKDSAVTLTVEQLQEWLGATDQAAEVDLTVADIAAQLERSPVTVRAWIRTGDLRAYSFRGREYRITRQAFNEFLEAQRHRYSTTSPRGR